MPRHADGTHCRGAHCAWAGDGGHVLRTPGVVTVTEHGSYEFQPTCTDGWEGSRVYSIHAARNSARMHADQEGCVAEV